MSVDRFLVLLAVSHLTVSQYLTAIQCYCLHYCHPYLLNQPLVDTNLLTLFSGLLALSSMRFLYALNYSQESKYTLIYLVASVLNSMICLRTVTIASKIYLNSVVYNVQGYWLTEISSLARGVGNVKSLARLLFLHLHRYIPSNQSYAPCTCLHVTLMTHV